jgi:hypothetical protein
MLSFRQATRLTAFWLLFLALITAMAFRSTEARNATLIGIIFRDVKDPLKIEIRGTLP